MSNMNRDAAIDCVIQLRLRTDTTTDWLDLEVVFSGTLEECEAYALQHGWKFRQDKDMMFGGYYTKDDGNCLYPS